MTSHYYEIRVAGILPPEALLDFERLSASVQPVETVVHGLLQDQAALQGFLARLETFGVQVLEVRRLQDENPHVQLAAAELPGTVPAAPALLPGHRSWRVVKTQDPVALSGRADSARVPRPAIPGG